MPNEFKIRNGLIVDAGVSVISGSLIVLGGITGSLSGSSTGGGGGSGSAFPFTGSAEITGSLGVIGGVSISGSQTTSGSITFTRASTPSSVGTIGRGPYGLEIRGVDGGSGGHFLIGNAAGEGVFMGVSGTRHLTTWGRLGVGLITTSPTSRLHVRGEGATSATTTLRVENSAATASLVILDNNSGSYNGNFSLTGSLTVGPSSINSAGQFVPGAAAGSNDVSSGTWRISTLNTGNHNQTLTLQTMIHNPGSGESTTTRVVPSISNSGTGIVNAFAIVPIVSQSVGATGATRGLYVNPTLTSAADWRSIEWNNNTGFGLYGSGSSHNILRGNTTIGTLITGSSTLNVSGSSSFNGNMVISGSLTVTGGINGDDPDATFPFTGSAQITGSLAVIGPTRLNGPLVVTGSGTTSATRGLVVVNSAGDFGMQVRDDNTTIVRSLTIATNPALIPASGTGSLVIAPDFTTTGSDYSLVIGQAIKQGPGGYSVLVGSSINVASGSTSVLSVGGGSITGSGVLNVGSNTIRARSGFAVGSSNLVTGSLTFSAGFSAIIGTTNTSSFNSFVVGEENKITADRSIVLGVSNTTNGTGRNYIIGGNNTSTGLGTMFMMGYYLSGSRNSYQTVFGIHNQTNSNALFIIGDGINTSSRRNVLEIIQNTNAAQVSNFNLTASVNITGSSAQTSLNVVGNTVISGSLTVTGGINGDDPDATFPFTGSAQITGSLAVIGPTRLNGPLVVTGSGTTSATRGLVVVNSAGDFGMQVRDDNTTIIRSLIISPGYFAPAAGTGSLVIAPDFLTTGSNYSLVIGQNIKQGPGGYGVVVGYDNIDVSSGSLSTLTIGALLTTSGSHTTNIGYQNTVRGNYSAAFGRQHTISGSYNTVFGSENSMTTGSFSAVFGLANTVRSTLSLVAGTGNNSVGGPLAPRAFILGDNNLVTGSGGGTTWCIGTSLTGSSGRQIVLGQYNINTPSADFIIGSGLGNTTRANAFVITQGDGGTIPTTIEMTGSILISGSHTTHSALGIRGNTTITGSLIISGSATTPFQVGSNLLFVSGSGNVGIGTTSPAERLHIEAAGNGGDVPLYVSGDNTKGGNGYLDFLYAENTGGGSNPKKFFRINNAGSWEVVNDAYSNTIFTLDDSGNLNIAGTLTQNSDVNLKTNIQTIPNALEKTLQLRGVEYDRISTNKHELGLIAQEVEQVLPELVSETNGVKSVAYSNLVGVLVESIKELKKEIDTLREQINKQ